MIVIVWNTVFASLNVGSGVWSITHGHPEWAAVSFGAATASILVVITEAIWRVR